MTICNKMNSNLGHNWQFMRWLRQESVMSLSLKSADFSMGLKNASVAVSSLQESRFLELRAALCCGFALWDPSLLFFVYMALLPADCRPEASQRAGATGRRAADRENDYEKAVVFVCRKRDPSKRLCQLKNMPPNSPGFRSTFPILW